MPWEPAFWAESLTWRWQYGSKTHQHKVLFRRLQQKPKTQLSSLCQQMKTEHLSMTPLPWPQVRDPCLPFSTLLKVWIRTGTSCFPAGLQLVGSTYWASSALRFSNKAKTSFARNYWRYRFNRHPILFFLQVHYKFERLAVSMSSTTRFSSTDRHIIKGCQLYIFFMMSKLIPRT